MGAPPKTSRKAQHFLFQPWQGFAVRHSHIAVQGTYGYHNPRQAGGRIRRRIAVSDAERIAGHHRTGR